MTNCSNDGMPTRDDGAYIKKPDPRKSTMENSKMSDVALNDIADRFEGGGIRCLNGTDVEYLIDELQLARRVMDTAPLRRGIDPLPPAEPDPIEARLDALEQFAAGLASVYPDLLVTWENAFNET